MILIQQIVLNRIYNFYKDRFMLLSFLKGYRFFNKVPHYAGIPRYNRVHFFELSWIWYIIVKVLDLSKSRSGTPTPLRKGDKKQRCKQKTAKFSYKPVCAWEDKHRAMRWHGFTIQILICRCCTSYRMSWFWKTFDNAWITNTTAIDRHAINKYVKYVTWPLLTA